MVLHLCSRVGWWAWEHHPELPGGQWLSLHSQCRGPGSILGQGTRLHLLQDLAPNRICFKFVLKEKEPSPFLGSSNGLSGPTLAPL